MPNKIEIIILFALLSVAGCASTARDQTQFKRDAASDHKKAHRGKERAKIRYIRLMRGSVFNLLENKMIFETLPNNSDAEIQMADGRE